MSCVCMRKTVILSTIFGTMLSLMLSSCKTTDTSSTASDDTSNTSEDQTSITTNENIKDVVLNVTIPEPLEEGEFLTIGSNINDWDPSNKDYTATKVDDLNYQLSLQVDTSAGDLQIQYKWTIQLDSFASDEIWAGVEKGPQGEELENRIIDVLKSQSETLYVNDTVVKFADPTAPVVPTVVGNLDIIKDIDMPQFDNRTRTIRVYTPSNYSENIDKNYPVIYMQDGQNLFDATTSFAGEWGVDELMEELLIENKEAIVVGIDNSSHRMDEYTPDWSDQPEAEGDKYLKFIIETLKPYIDEKYRTLKDNTNTYIAGSSMGGLISFYGALKYPEVFGNGACLSSSFQINTQEARIEFLESLDYKNTPRLFLSVGDSEPLKPYLSQVSDELIASGFPSEKLYTYTKENGSHNEASWRNTFPLAYEWLSSGENGNYVEKDAVVEVNLTMPESVEDYLTSLASDGNIYLYNGQLATSVKLERQAKGVYSGSFKASLNDTLQFYVLYHKDNVIDVFALDDNGEELLVTYEVLEETSNLDIVVNEFERKNALTYNITVPENFASYATNVGSGQGQLIMYTGLLANSYYPTKISDTSYQLKVFLSEGETIRFQFLFYDANVGFEAFEIDENGESVGIHTLSCESESETQSYEIKGFQLPINLRVEVTLQDDFEIPSDQAFLLGLYSGIFGTSYRDSPLALLEGRTYYLEVETVASTIEFVVGYCTGPSEGNYDYQEFETDPSDNSLAVVSEKVCIPFSEYDPENLNTYTIKYTTQYFKNA